MITQWDGPIMPNMSKLDISVRYKDLPDLQRNALTTLVLRDEDLWEDLVKIREWVKFAETLYLKTPGGLYPLEIDSDTRVVGINLSRLDTFVPVDIGIKKTYFATEYEYVWDDGEGVGADNLLHGLFEPTDQIEIVSTANGIETPVKLHWEEETFVTFNRVGTFFKNEDDASDVEEEFYENNPDTPHGRRWEASIGDDVFDPKFPSAKFEFKTDMSPFQIALDTNGPGVAVFWYTTNHYADSLVKKRYDGEVDAVITKIRDVGLAHIAFVIVDKETAKRSRPF